jgi:hypothetical protein
MCHKTIYRSQDGVYIRTSFTWLFCTDAYVKIHRHELEPQGPLKLESTVDGIETCSGTTEDDTNYWRDTKTGYQVACSNLRWEVEEFDACADPDSCKENTTEVEAIVNKAQERSDQAKREKKDSQALKMLQAVVNDATNALMATREVHVECVQKHEELREYVFNEVVYNKETATKSLQYWASNPDRKCARSNLEVALKRTFTSTIEPGEPHLSLLNPKSGKDVGLAFGDPTIFGPMEEEAKAGAAAAPIAKSAGASYEDVCEAVDAAAAAVREKFAATSDERVADATAVVDQAKSADTCGNQSTVGDSHTNKSKKTIATSSEKVDNATAAVGKAKSGGASGKQTTAAGSDTDKAKSKNHLPERSGGGGSQGRGQGPSKGGRGRGAAK